MLNILETVSLQSREGKRCLYLAAAGLLHLEEEEKRQHEQQDGLEIKEETTLSTRKNQGHCGLDGWLEDMSSEFGHYDQLLTE